LLKKLKDNIKLLGERHQKNYILGRNGAQVTLQVNWCNIKKYDVTSAMLPEQLECYLEGALMGTEIGDRRKVDYITIGCGRTDRPPWNTAPPRVWWARMIEDQCDGYGETAAEAIGDLVMEIARLWDGNPMPYIKVIDWEGKSKD
jgi:hypothetical protein